MPTDTELGVEAEGIESTGRNLKGGGNARASSGIEITSDDGAPVFAPGGDQDCPPWHSRCKAPRGSERTTGPIAYDVDSDSSPDDLIVEGEIHPV